MSDSGLLFKEAWTRWRGANAAGLAAALAYYALFAIVPFTVVILAVIGTVLGSSNVQYELGREIADLFGRDVAVFVINLVNSTSASQTGAAALISGAIALVGAFGAFSQLKWSLDHIWQAPPRIKKTLFQLMPDVAVFLIMLIVGALLVLSSILSSVITLLAQNVDKAQSSLGAALLMTDVAIFFFMSWGLISAVYYFLPNLRLRVRDTFFGSMLTAALLTGGRILIGFYLQLRNITSVYGAASAIILLLLWVYFSALIFYFGAELTYVYAHRRRIAAREALTKHE